MAHRTVTYRGAGGLRLVGDVHGDDDRPPVLFLHGGGQTRHSWGRAAEVVARRGWRAVNLDQRGHGDSQWASDGDYRIDAFAADAVAVAAQLGAPPVLVGASLGGIAGLLAEGELAPGTLRALVLVDIVPRMEPAGVERIMAFMGAAPEGFASIAEAADAVAAYLPHRERPSDVTGLRRNLRRGPDGRWRWHWDPAFVTGVRSGSGVPDTRRWERLDAAARALAVPVLVVRGARSEIVSPEGVAHFLTLVPHAEVADIAEAHHMVAGDRNDRFNAAVAAFLDRLGS